MGGDRRSRAIGRERSQRTSCGRSFTQRASLRPYLARRRKDGVPMKANVWLGKKKVEVREVPDPRILNESDAIVRVTSTAICGSDLHLYNGFMPSMEKGDVLGHEFMGEVVEVGRGVKNLKAGDRVVVPFCIACGNCEQCELKNFSACEDANPNGWMPEKLMG